MAIDSKKKFWGNGFATEISNELLKKAFQEYGAKTVFAQAMKGNIASQKVMQKIGMSFVTEFNEKSFPVGFQEAVLFSIRS